MEYATGRKTAALPLLMFLLFPFLCFSGSSNILEIKSIPCRSYDLFWNYDPFDETLKEIPPPPLPPNAKSFKPDPYDVITYYENDQIKSRWYYNKNDLPDGNCFDYYKNGNIRNKWRFNNGVLEYIRTFYGNKKICMPRRFENGKLNGISSIYYPDGNIAFQAFYTNGVLNGECKLFYPDGNLRWRGNYKAAKLDGTIDIFHSDKTLKEKLIYENGRLIFGFGLDHLAFIDEADNMLNSEYALETRRNIRNKLQNQQIFIIDIRLQGPEQKISIKNADDIEKESNECNALTGILNHLMQRNYRYKAQ